jgi:signal transduction histidine kinase
MTAAVVTVAILAVLAAGGLVGLTTVPHAMAQRSSDAMQCLRIAEAMQRNLLLHDRVEDREARRQIGVRLHEQVERERGLVATEPERSAVDGVDHAVSAYLAADEAAMPASERAARHELATAELELLAGVELKEAQAAEATMRRYDSAADAVGVSIAGFVIMAGAVIVWWLHSRALKPLLELSQKMRSFGRGNLDERAAEEGPAEVAEMASRFNEMAESIARQRQERQTFIAGVVHDLRNPLSVLRMSTDLVCAEGADVPPQRMKKVLGAVSRQVDRLDRMAGDLLDSMSIASGNVRLRLEDHDARDIANEIVQLYTPVSSAHVIELDVPPAAVPLRCDAMRVEQVLSNLVSNAIKYSPDGGRVSLEVQPAEHGEVKFVVRDEGVGMSEEDAARAFEPFRRGAKVRDAVPGSGLGLFVVRRLVEAHGGHIDVHTSPGTGSTFEVSLPAT